MIRLNNINLVSITHHFWYQSLEIDEKLRSTIFAPKWIRRNIVIRLLLDILSIIIIHALFFSDYLESTTKITAQF